MSRNKMIPEKLATKVMLLFLLQMVPTSRAFSSISLPAPRNEGIIESRDSIQQSSEDSASTVTRTRASWRVVLDIGREPLSSMPLDWARSGRRLPLVVPSDFVTSSSSSSAAADDSTATIKGEVYTQSDTVSFTGPEGAVVSRVLGGDWEIKKQKKGTNEIVFSLTFPETMARRDVTIDAGTVLTLSGTVYTKEEMDRLNQEFYDARDEVWKIGEELNEMARRQGAPKKWNEEKQQWEKRYLSESPLRQMQKRLQLMAAQAVQGHKNNARPSSKEISEQGSFPGSDKGLFMKKEGVVRIQGGPVVGKWFAEPILY